MIVDSIVSFDRRFYKHDLKTPVNYFSIYFILNGVLKKSDEIFVARNIFRLSNSCTVFDVKSYCILCNIHGHRNNYIVRYVFLFPFEQTCLSTCTILQSLKGKKNY